MLEDIAPPAAPHKHKLNRLSLTRARTLLPEILRAPPSAVDVQREKRVVEMKISKIPVDDFDSAKIAPPAPPVSHEVNTEDAILRLVLPF